VNALPCPPAVACKNPNLAIPAPTAAAIPAVVK
jgi:hypothetical protein